MYIDIYRYVYMYICVYIYIYISSRRVEVDLNVHKPDLKACVATTANWDTAPLLHLAKP